MVEVAIVTIIAHHLHRRVLKKHEIVGRAAAASRSHDGAVVRALPTENPRQALRPLPQWVIDGQPKLSNDAPANRQSPLAAWKADRIVPSSIVFC